MSKKIERITKLITEGKVDEALELAEVNDIEDLFGLGNLFGQREAYQVAEKIFNRVVQLTPNLVEAWCNKGVALGKLGKYDEEIECYDKAIRINPNDDKAWYNKGNALGKLGKNDEEIECYDEAIRINPKLAEAYGNKGITLLNRQKYNEAEAELEAAKKLFTERGRQKDADKAHSLKLVAKNASKLISEILPPLDKKFINCLYSQSLTELEQQSSEIAREAKALIDKYKKRKLPEEALELLLSKTICFTVLSDAVAFKKVNPGVLVNAKKVFEQWNLNTFIFAVNSLDTFIRSLNEYKSIDEIPKDREGILLQGLGVVSALDGELTKEISGKIKGEPYSIVREEAPEIICIPIPNIGNDSINVCLVQLDFGITKKFPYQLEQKEEVREKIVKALQVANQEGINIICFPELSFAQEFIDEAKQYKDMIIIGGSYYHEDFNICPVIINGKEYPVYKIHPAPYFEGEIEPGKGMKPGKDIKIFETENKKFRFGVLICIDYLCESHHYKDKGVNFIFIPSFNPHTERFQKFADSYCTNNHVDLMLTNVKEYGGTCIIGVEHEAFIQRLINEGYRENDNIEYKLYESRGEMMIMAKLSLRGVEVPTSSGAKPRIQIIGRYIYKNGCWENPCLT